MRFMDGGSSERRTPYSRKTQKEGAQQVNSFRRTKVETRATRAPRHTNYNTTVKIKMEGWHMGS